MLNAEDSSQTDKRRWTLRRILTLSVVLCVVCLVGAFLWYSVAPRGPGISISRETSYLTEPVGDDGYIDYMAALMDREPIPAQQNAAQLYVQVAGLNLNEFLTPDAISAVCDQLDLTFPFDPTAKLLSVEQFGEAREADGIVEPTVGDLIDLAESQYERCLAAPWTPEEFPLLQSWLEANARPLEMIVEGTRRPGFQLRPRQDVMLSSYLLPLQQAMRGFSRALAIRAMSRIGQGDLDGAAEDVDALHRLSNQRNKPAFVIEMLVSFAMDAVAVDTEKALIAHLSTPEAVRRRRQIIAERPPLDGYIESINYSERCGGLSAIQYVDREARGIVPAGTAMLPWTAGQFAFVRRTQARMVDTDAASRQLNQYFDRFVAAFSMPVDERVTAISALEAELQSPNPKSVRGSFPMGQTLQKYVLLNAIAPIARFDEAYRRHTTRSKLLDVACAARLFELEQGRTANQQSDLVPKYLAEWPTDDIFGKPFEDAIVDDRWIVFHRIAAEETKRPSQIFHSMRIDIPYSIEFVIPPR